METENKIKILFIEDVPSDKELAEMELRKEGIVFISEVVETKNDFIQALNVFKPDLIISDYSLPSFDGMQALTIAKEFYPTVPFILYTGSLNEETAVECIKAGAWDYVIKEHSARLPFAVKEAMEKKAKLKILKQSEDKYQTIFESTGTATLIVEEDTTITMVNAECILLTGYSSAELIGTKWTNYVAPESIELMMKYDKIRREDPSKAPKKYEVNLVNKKGEVRNAILNVGFITEAKQRIVSVLDITERKKAERVLQEIISKNPMSIQIVDRNGYTLSVNSAHTKLFGSVPPPDFTIFNDSQLEMQGFKELFERVKKGEVLHFPDSYYNAHDFNPALQDVPVWVRGVVFPLMDSNGNPERFVLMQDDITERKKAEEELISSEAKYRNLIETMPEGFYRSTPEGYFAEVNPAFVKMLGYESTEELMKIYIPEELYFLKDERDNRGGDNTNFTSATEIYRLKKKDGSEIWVEDFSRYIKDESGKIIYHEGIMRDITESLRAHSAIIEAKNKAEEMSRLKSSFLSNMSHEIRTPLNGILGFAQLLQEDVKDDEQLKFVKVIEKSGNRLLETLDLILNFSKLEAETVSAKYRKVNVSEVIDEVVDSFEAMAKIKNLVIEKQIKQKSLVAQIDERFLRHVLNNLMKNAIVYTKKGRITVMFDKDEKDMIIKVKDTGIGIAKENFDLIFEPFRQESEGYGRNFEGTGLGLSITKRFVELMKGKIEVESEAGAGSTFTVRLPFTDADTTREAKTGKKEIAKKAPDDKTQEKKELSILLVENDESNRYFTLAVLNKYYKTEFAVDGYGAIEAAKKKNYDIILMDINLGKEIDGIMATKEIRKMKGYKDTPIVAMTAYVREGDKEEFLAGGCTHYLGKPFTVKQLLDLVEGIRQ